MASKVAHHAVFDGLRGCNIENLLLNGTIKGGEGTLITKTRFVQRWFATDTMKHVHAYAAQ